MKSIEVKGFTNHKNLITRFNRFVAAPDTNGCRNWTGGKTYKGYGVFKFQGKSMGAHKAAAVALYGTVKKGLLVCHKCDNPSCVNPHHMYIGTAKQNQQDCVIRGRKPRVGVPRKLMQTDIPVIRYMRTRGISQRSIAHAFGIADATVRDIEAGKMWKWVK